LERDFSFFSEILFLGGEGDLFFLGEGDLLFFLGDREADRLLFADLDLDLDLDLERDRDLDEERKRLKGIRPTPLLSLHSRAKCPVRPQLKHLSLPDSSGQSRAQ